MEEVDR